MVVTAAKGGQQQPLPLPDKLSPQQLREWRRQQSQQETFSPQLLSELFSHLCVPGSVEAAALGASESATALGASESAAAPGASESAAALGARASTATSPASAEALHTFTLDSSIMHSRLLVSGLPRSLPSLPRLPAPPCLPCVEGRQRAAPHSSEFPPTTAPLQTLHMDVCASGFIGTCQSCVCTLTGVRRIGLIMEVARTSMIHAAAPHFLWPFAVRYAAHQLNLWRHISEPETSPTLRWTGKVGDASVFWVWGALSLVRNAKASKLSFRTLRCVFLGFPTETPSWQFYHPRAHPLPPQGPAPSAEEGDPAVDETAATHRSPRLETPPGLLPRPSSPPPQPAAVDSGAGTAGAAEPRGAETEGEGSGGVATGGADSG
ncbi:unnamed protein product [Closterium sp. NIES-53]